MIDNQHGRIVLECDSCPETFEGERGAEWSEVWPVAQREGWRSRKIAGIWLHGCEKCGAPT